MSEPYAAGQIVEWQEGPIVFVGRYRCALAVDPAQAVVLAGDVRIAVVPSEALRPSEMSLRETPLAGSAYMEEARGPTTDADAAEEQAA